MGYRNYGPAAGYTVAKDGTGDFSTIAAALTAAGALGGNGTIVIKDGTYTENPALVASWNLVAWDADALTPNVIINGKCTFSSAGTVSISGIEFQTNSDFFLAVTGSAASIIYLKNCYLNALNNTGISYSSSSGSSSINIINCFGNIGTTGIGMWTATGAGSIALIASFMNNSGLSTTASTTSACPVSHYNTSIGFPVSCSSSGTVNFYNSQSVQATNAVSLTTAGTGTSQVYNSYLASGTSSAISVGAGTTVFLAESTIASSNTNSITGAGVITYSGIAFAGTSSTINTTTKTPLSLRPGLLLDKTGSSGTTGQVPVATTGSEFTWAAASGAWNLVSTQTASSSASISFTSGFTTNLYALVWYGVVPSVSTAFLTIQVSVNGGSTYISTGYTSGVTWTKTGTTTSGGTTSSSFVLLTGGVGTAANQNAQGICYFNSNGVQPCFWGLSTHYSTDSVGWDFANFGNTNTTASTVNAIKLTFQGSGNIASGTFSLYTITN